MVETIMMLFGVFLYSPRVNRVVKYVTQGRITTYIIGHWFLISSELSHAFVISILVIVQQTRGCLLFNKIIVDLKVWLPWIALSIHSFIWIFSTNLYFLTESVCILNVFTIMRFCCPHFSSFWFQMSTLLPKLPPN